MPSDEPRAVPTPTRVGLDADLRLDLDSGWEAAACPPDACPTPAEAQQLEWIAAAVPGTAAGAMRAAGLWSPGDAHDFDTEDWWFRTSFEAAAPADGEEVVLCLGGVATVSEIFLNGELIERRHSMFRSGAVDVGSRLRPGGNELAIRCRALGPLLGERRRPRARWRSRLADNRLRFQRTMLLGRCPGFAPGPAAVGPWRPVWLERRRGFVVEGLDLRPRCEGSGGELAISARLRVLGPAPEGARLLLSGPGDAEAPLELRDGGGGTVELAGSLRLAEVERWWPHTHGQPTLYDLRLSVSGSAGEVLLDAGRVGFREIAPGPEPGHDPIEQGLDLHVNGVRTFARGVVWTPLDPVGMAPSREELAATLGHLREAGMNMVRIPGTGAYESPWLHDLCDELGILVWQDFAFANFDYPVADEGFRAEVEAEARQELAALAGRPSLAVLCGNSEVEQQVAMLGLDPELGRGELFGALLPGICAELAPDAPYLPSAPCGGELPFRPGAGVANYYGVGGYRRPLSDVRLSGVRFAAECLAFANVPEPEGVEAILPGAAADVVVHHPRWKAGVPRDVGTGWDFDDVRDHYLRELFGIDPGELRRYDHERYLELSRVLSGEAMAAVFGEWRRPASPCGGGLVLWSKDLQPGAGWGLLDAAGEPKRALGHLGRALAPTAVWMTDEGLSGVGLHVANDGPEELRATLRVGLYRDLEQQVGEASEELELGPHAAVSRDLEGLLGHFVDASWAYRFGPPGQDAIVATLLRDDRPLSQAVHFPAGRPAGTETAQRLGLRGEGARGEDGRVSLTLCSDRLLYCPRVEARGFETAAPACLEPGVERRIEMTAVPGVEPADAVAVSAVNMRGRATLAIA